VSAADNNTDNFNTDPASIGVSWLPYSGAVKIDKTAVVQSVGTSTTKVMSQKAVTDELKEIAEALGQVQVQGAASWSADGAPYPASAQVYHNGKQWLARRANSAEPAEGEDWAELVGKQFINAALIDQFIKPERGKPLLEKTGVTSVKIPAGLRAAVGGTLIALDADITLSLVDDLVGSAAVAGTDYFVYLKPDATAYISASDAEPEGRLIAGFHYGLTGHTETPSGNKTEADMVKLRGINAHTFWDLTFRANKWTNRGLTFDGMNWIDIYLADEEYAVRGWSKAGGWIAGGEITNGRKFPVIPEMFGGDGAATYGKLTPFVAWDMLNAAGMEPISYKQFSHAMYGVEEGLSADGIETVVGKIEHYPRLTSRFGVEQATGVQWIWGADFGSSSSGTWNNVTDGRGQVFSGVTVVLLGASRDYAAGRSGSCASHWDNGLTHSYWGRGVRGLRDHLSLD